MARKRAHLLFDLFFIALSGAAAFYIVQADLVHLVLPQLREFQYFGVFVAGMFFTTAFTTIPAIAILGEFAQEGSIVLVALIGGLGAVVGDYIIFRFFRDRVSDDVQFVLQGAKIRRLPRIFKTQLFHFLIPLTGAIIIASPLPDELGLALLGLSKLNTRTFLIIAYVMNTLGILLIGLIASAA